MGGGGGLQPLSNTFRCCLENAFFVYFSFLRSHAEYYKNIPSDFVQTNSLQTLPFLGIAHIAYYLEKLQVFEVLPIASCFHGFLRSASTCYHILVPSTPIRIVQRSSKALDLLCSWNVCLLKWCYWKPFPCYFILNIACTLPGETVWKHSVQAHTLQRR